VNGNARSRQCEIMAKSEIFNEYHTGGGLAEIERPFHRQLIDVAAVADDELVKK